MQLLIWEAEPKLSFVLQDLVELAVWFYISICLYKIPSINCLKAPTLETLTHPEPRP